MYSCVVCGAGQGKRTNLSFNKIFYKIKGKALISYTLKPFIEDVDCEEIILVVSDSDFSETRDIVDDQKVKVILGGASRQESVYEGLKIATSDIVFVHDGARPNIHRLFIDKCKQEIINKRAITLAIPVKDTLKIVKSGIMSSMIDRENTMQLQTPQVFYREELFKAHERAVANNHFYTDDATLYLSELGKDVSVLLGDEFNIKATTMIDLLVLEEILC